MDGCMDDGSNNQSLSHGTLLLSVLSLQSGAIFTREP